MDANGASTCILVDSGISSQSVRGQLYSHTPTHDTQPRASKSPNTTSPCLLAAQCYTAGLAGQGPGRVPWPEGQLTLDRPAAPVFVPGTSWQLEVAGSRKEVRNDG